MSEGSLPQKKLARSEDVRGYRQFSTEGLLRGRGKKCNFV